MMSDLGEGPPTYDDVREAALRLRGMAVRTPLLESEALNARVGGRLLLKAEPLQRTGSFKFRGAYNAIASLRPPAVVAYSSGNHAQGVALAARLLGVPATIVMPADAPRIKLDGTCSLGAEVVTYDRWRESREAIGQEIAGRTGAVLIRPFDEPLVIAGQGTVGLEMADEALRRGTRLDTALVSCSGGGLVAGCATALHDRIPGIEVFAVEPEGFDNMARSLQAGQRVANTTQAPSICDALLAPMPGEITFAINRQLLAGGLSVPDEAVCRAMRLAFHHLKIVTEPGGAVALAAALSGRLDCRNRVVGIVLSGGNVDPALFARILLDG